MGVHAQDNRPTGWDNAMHRMPDRMAFKTVDRGDMNRTVSLINGSTFNILRHFAGDNFQWSLNWADNVRMAEDSYRTFIDGTFKEQYAPYIDGVEDGRNETDSHVLSPEERETRTLWFEAASYVWNRDYKHQLQQYRPPGSEPIRLVLENIAVGNDPDRRVAVAAIDNDDVIGYHFYIAVFQPNFSMGEDLLMSPGRTNMRENTLPYRVPFSELEYALAMGMEDGPPVIGERSPGDWMWASGRPFARWEPMWGLKPKIVGTEGGLIRDYTGGLILDPMGGWRLLGNRDNYIWLMRSWLMDVQQTPAYQEGRFLGWTNFTIPGDAPWQQFAHNADDMVALFHMAREEWNPGTIVVPPPAAKAKGVDVSRWQGDINWQTAKNNDVSFAFIKATERDDWIDPRYADNVAGAKAAGIRDGAYHFYRPSIDPVAQAEHFYSVIGDDNALPPVLDVEVFAESVHELTLAMSDEGDGHMGMAYQGDFHLITANASETSDRNEFAANVYTCLREIGNLTGRRPILYTNPGFYAAYLSYIDFSEVADLWIAHWGVQVPVIPGDYDNWTFWQYANDGNGPQYGMQSARVDLNYFNGDVVDLDEYIANSQPVPPPPPGEVLVYDLWFDTGYHDVPPNPPGTQTPDGWEYEREVGTNYGDGEPWNDTNKTEARKMDRTTLPEHEWPMFLNSRGVSLKEHANNAYRTRRSTTLSLTPGRYRVVLDVHGDWYKWVNNQKVHPGEPDHAKISLFVDDMVYEFIPEFLDENVLEATFDLAIEGPTQVGFWTLARFAIPGEGGNNGCFFKRFSVYRSEYIPPPPPGHRRVINLMPQPRDGWTVKMACIVADRTFDKAETMLYSADDAVDIYKLGNEQSVVKVWNPEFWQDDIVVWLNEHGVANVEVYDVTAP